MHERLEELRIKLDAYTVRIGEQTYEHFEHVVVVPFGDDLNAGFERLAKVGAKRALLIGHGATLPGTWPAWVRHADGLTLRELGAYRTHTLSQPTEPIRHAVARWTDRIFAFKSIKGSDALYAMASTRLLTVTFDMRGIAENIATAHADDAVAIVGGMWADLEQEIASDSRGAPLRRTAMRMAWVPALTAAWGAGLALTLFREMQGVRASARSLKEIRERRARPIRPGKRADTWIVVIPDLMRVNRHVIESAAMPLLRAGRLRGVLLAETLADGVRTETRFERQKTTDLWPGLADVRTHLDEIEIDQVVRGETTGEIAGDIVASIAASTRALIRLAAAGPWIPESARHEHPLFFTLREVAALTTTDVFRVVTAERATARAVQRRSFDGAPIVFVSSSSPALAASTAVLNNAGATTIDFFHGAAIAMTHGGVESPAKVHLLWTQTDATAFEAIGCHAIEAGMPIRVTKNERRRGGRRVLIMSNYAHRDEVIPFSMPLQNELLRIAALAPPGFELRWRPHPADRPERIKETLAMIPPVELSPNVSLEADVAWADYIVSSLSSAVIEAFFAEIPAFIQVPPHFAGLHVHSFADSTRIFFRAEELWPKLLEVEAAFARGEDPTAPELAARKRLFGSTAFPHPVDIDRIAAQK